MPPTIKGSVKGKDGQGQAFLYDPSAGQKVQLLADVQSAASNIQVVAYGRNDKTGDDIMEIKGIDQKTVGSAYYDFGNSTDPIPVTISSSNWLWVFSPAS